MFHRVGNVLTLVNLLWYIYVSDITYSTIPRCLDNFYLRYYVGHKRSFRHEFLEFGFRPDGELRWVVWECFMMLLTVWSAGMLTSASTRTTPWSARPTSIKLSWTLLRRVIEDSEVSMRFSSGDFYFLISRSWRSWRLSSEKSTPASPCGLHFKIKPI